MATTQSTSLLGLPRELRLHIYDHVLEEDTDYTPLNGMKGGWDRDHGGFNTEAIRNQGALLRLSWLSLLRTCRTIATEIRGLIRDTVDGDSARTTYVMATDIGLENTKMSEVKWCRVPCAPRDARAMMVHLGVHVDMQFGGDGGPRPIVRCMYQTLNLALHCGPRMDPVRPLAQPLHLHELVIIVHERDGPEPREEEYHTTSGWAYRRIASNMGSLCHTGLLAGLVDKVRVTSGTKEIEPHLATENGGVPALWGRYGFEWGLETWER